jgi:hypothetical protein
VKKRITGNLISFCVGALVALAVPYSAAAQGFEKLCDPKNEDCRTPLLNLIRNEQQGIDVAFWFMTDARYSFEIRQRFNAGVPVRVLVDEQSNRSHPQNATILQELKNAGIPMRRRNSGGILHWKMMLFHGQDMVQFSAANYEGPEFKYQVLGSDYIDEAIYFSNDGALVDSFRTKFDDLWTNISRYVNYANISGALTRRYPTYPVVSWMNFPPGQNYATRAVGRYVRETDQIDVIMYRITDARHTNALIDAKVNRGVPVRLITEPLQYRDPTKIWHSYNVDRMYMAGVEIKQRKHAGYMHQKSVILRGLGEVIFGSSNWTEASANQQDEHNVFYSPSVGKPWFYQWFVDQFEDKWNDTSGFVPFVPLPPDNPVYQAPANGAAGLPLTVTLRWDGGNWAHKYDVYFSDNEAAVRDGAESARIATDLAVGSPVTGVSESFMVGNLAAGRTYYWRIVGKTMADQANSASTWSFTTAGGSGGGGSGTDIVLYAGRASVKAGTWESVSDPAAAGGVAMRQIDRGAAKVGTPSASPANYFEMSFNAQAGIPYRLWIRGKAQNDSWRNDSVWFQFTNTVDGSGTPVWRIGSASGTWAGVEDCSGCGMQGWGWQDNGYGTGVLGPPVYFATTGVQTLRVQQREDGITIDQIVLSPSTYLENAPGATKNDTTILPETGGTQGDPPPAGINEIVMHALGVTTIDGNWSKVNDGSAADGVLLRNPNAGAPKLNTALAAPASYFEKSFTADAGKPYHIWIRMKAENNQYSNDSVFVQFSSSRDAGGTARWRIGTTDALAVSLENGNGAGVQGWGWNDNSYSSIGAPIYFSASGEQTIRVQVREDGVSIDQIVLSAAQYLSSSPGAYKNDTTILPATVP